jgi:hypothetical protein
MYSVLNSEIVVGRRLTTVLVVWAAPAFTNAWVGFNPFKVEFLQADIKKKKKLKSVFMRPFCSLKTFRVKRGKKYP